MNRRIVFFAVFYALVFLLPSLVKAQNAVWQNEFNFNWTYQKIFGPENISLPASMAGTANPRVAAVYSPSVVKINNQYVMFFGVSLYCNNPEGLVARDSIALAKSNNGISWNFTKYIIEADPLSCTKPKSQWSNLTFQVNDPAVYLDPITKNKILVFYTSVISTQDNYGNIGLAIFDLNLNLLQRNDNFLTGTTVLSPYGYSRPSLLWSGPSAARLWFDSYTKVGSVDMNFDTPRADVNVNSENLSGLADINTPFLDSKKQILLYDGAPSLLAISRDTSLSQVWSAPWHILQPTNQGWDASYQGSPDLFIDNNTCEIKLYFAGAVMGGEYGGYSSLSIGVALPPVGKKFNFSICLNTKTGDIDKNGKIDIYDYNIFLINFGKTESASVSLCDLNSDAKIDIFDFNILVANFRLSIN